MSEPVALICVVAHTHWDREWYHPAERFRQRLVPLVDELLDQPPAPGTSFLLDGQAVLLEDYLAVRPERAAEVGALLRDGRLEAGPWYVLADELIPGGEALVRNLLAGHEVVRRLRGNPPPVLYCPDSFGHPAILPDLAAGFGCDVVVLWRGYGGRRWPSGDTVRWRGAAGHDVVLHHLPPDGYEFGGSLPADAREAAARWRSIADVLLPRATTGVALLLNGADHHARQRDQAAAVAALAAAARPVVVRATSLREAAARIAGAVAGTTLPIVSGELRDSYGYTWTLGGTLATRAAQKRRNALAERALVRDTEPWIALSTHGGDATTRALLGAAWRDLLRGHPHDTLCGTSVDAVADALDARLATVETQVDGLREDAVRSLLAHDAERARREPEAWRPGLVLRNPAARARGGVAEVTLARTVADVAVGPGSASRQEVPHEEHDDWPQRLGAQVLARARHVALTESPRAYPKAQLVEEVRALLWVEELGGYSVRCTPLDGMIAAHLPAAVHVRDTTVDNGLLRLHVDATGMVRLEEVATGRAVHDALRVEVQEDVGDLYTPAIRRTHAGMRCVGVERTLAGPLRGGVTLHFTDDAGSTLDVTLALDAGLAALRVMVRGTNARRDARLRLHLDGAVGLEAATVADAAFHPVARAPIAVDPVDAVMEHVVRTAPLHRFVSRFGAGAGMTVFSDGLAEYEALESGAIAVTLLRAVGELSRHDLPERPGHAGWPASTPGAQSQGPFAAELALALHGGDSPAQRDVIERLADDVLLPLRGDTLRSSLAPAPHTAGGLALEGEGLAFSAALPARAEGWIVLRCVNRRAEPVQGRWRLGIAVHEARLARLDETPLESLPLHDGTIAFEAAPMGIVTILARLEGKAAGG